MFKLDYAQKRIMQISNDAFFYLKDDEEPLDDSNIDEALEILNMFPNGFYIEENWAYVNDTDLVEASFIPYIEEAWSFDEYIDLFNDWQLQIKWLEDKEAVTIRFFNPTKEPFGNQICKVKYNENGKPYIVTDGHSIYPLWKNVKQNRSF